TRIGIVEILAGWEYAVAQRQYGRGELDTCRGPHQMTELRLCRRDRHALGVLAESLTQGRSLDDVGKLGGGAMDAHVIQRLGPDPRTVGAGRGARPLPAGVGLNDVSGVRRRAVAENLCPDPRSSALRALPRLQHEGGGALTDD